MKFGFLGTLALSAMAYFAQPQKAEAFLGFGKKAKRETAARPDNFLRMDGDTLVTYDPYVVNYGPNAGMTTVTKHLLNGKLVREEIVHSSRSFDNRQTLKIKNDPVKGMIGRFTSVGSDNALRPALNNILFWKPKADEKDPQALLDDVARKGTLVEMMLQENAVTVVGRIAQAPAATATPALKN